MREVEGESGVCCKSRRAEGEAAVMRRTVWGVGFW